MDMRESTEVQAFRAEVRGWLEAHAPNLKDDPYTYRGLDTALFSHDWFRILGQQGWLAYTWPQEYGGPGWDTARQLAFEDELRRLGLPLPFGFGLSLLGPPLMQFGTEAQKQRFLPPIARHEDIWCQGYSEPGAGSDLASLQTRAELSADGRTFTVNGQKIWTSAADQAQWIFLLVRTDPSAPKHKGISFLLVAMDSPGIEIRPIRQIDGQAGFYETFFENVQVPAENLLGGLNDGWNVAKSLLESERAALAQADMNGFLERVKRIARSYPAGDGTMLDDAGFRDHIAQLEMDADVFRYTRYRIESALVSGNRPGPESAFFKLYLSELSQRAHTAGLRAMGPDAAAWYDPRLSPDAFDLPMSNAIDRAITIYSGSSEVQRNIIAKRVLGLPD
jgi:alkylation response protein AidB-like acyl-CoA dehydrogenase